MAVGMLVGIGAAAAGNLFARRKSIFKASLNCLIAINQISIFQFYNLPSAASSKMNQNEASDQSIAPASIVFQESRFTVYRMSNTKSVPIVHPKMG